MSVDEMPVDKMVICQKAFPTLTWCWHDNDLSIHKFNICWC